MEATSCADCGTPISPKATRCKSCVNRLRWNGDDPRRAKLRDRNRAHRQNTPYADREWLRSRYEDDGRSLRAIAREADAGVRTIARWMDIHGIPTRDKATALLAVDRMGPANPNWRGASVCPTCGGKKRQPSAGCVACWTARKAGSGNPNWRGGITPEDSVLRTSNEYEEWRTAVFERDGFACQRCGDRRGGNLQAHHVLAWVHYPDRRFEVANGVTLCSGCHTSLHRDAPALRRPRVS